MLQPGQLGPPFLNIRQEKGRGSNCPTMLKLRSQNILASTAYVNLFLCLFLFLWFLLPPLLCLLLLRGLSLPATLTRVSHDRGGATGRSLISRLWGGVEGVGCVRGKGEE